MIPIDQERTTNILLVEDNKIDARLTRHAIQQMADWPSRIDILDDGEKALKFFVDKNGNGAIDKPDLVILDLNLPKCDGTEILQFIRASEELHNLLVFIFSSSPVEIALERMNNAKVKADSYFEKPSEVSTYFSIARQIRETYRLATSSA